MLEQSKVDCMNNALADLVIKRVLSLDPKHATHQEISSLAELAREVNSAPKTVHLHGVAIGKPLKPYKRKKHRKYKK